MKGKKHSEETKKKISASLMGHPVTERTRKAVTEANRIHKRHWKGGRIVRDGYVSILKPEHPMSDSLGYIKEHRLVAEKKIGRSLLREEVVHHINKKRADNRPENLEVMTIGQHMSLHNKGVKK